jgi:uncharacterized membrane protein YuzA (DUF378 family)
MRILYWSTLILAIVGSLNWGLVALADFNLVSYLFGENSSFTNAVYSLVGISGFYLFMHSIGNIAKKSIH